MYQASPIVSHKKTDPGLTKRCSKGRFFKPFIQPKITIGPPNDSYEQEADAVAERVMRMPDTKKDALFFHPKPITVMPVQRKCSACENEEKLHRKEDEKEELIQQKKINYALLQRKCVHCEQEEENLQMKGEQNGGGSVNAPSIVHDVINSGGQPMDKGAKQFMESRFGYDFENVQIHHDARANDSSEQLDALAYTHGSHVVFGAGQYQPDTDTGKQLLAHELTHVVQQAVEPCFARRSILRQAADESDNLYTDILDVAGSVIGNIGNTILDVGKTLGDSIHSGICAIGSQSTQPVTNPLWDISTFQSPGASGWFGAKFGCYRNNCGRRHHGWDIHAPVGNTAMAVVSGNVTHHNNTGGYGHYIDLASDADPNLVYRYAHLSAWEPNGHYCPGDMIGATGVTGNSDAKRPHLHLQVIDNRTAVDPLGYFTEPSYVIEQTGTSATVINKGDPEPCVPC